MGLDTVQLVMEIEDEFGITIPGTDAETIHTCGQLCAYVLRRIGAQPPDRTGCPTARAFYELRKALMRQVPLPKSSFRPRTMLCEVITRPYRRRWPAVAREIGLGDFYSFDRRCEVFFPAAFTRLADLARRITLPKPWNLPELGGTRQERVCYRIRQIISQITAIPREKIHPDSNLIRDLGMG